MVAIVGAGGACNKPSADDCRKAISNMQVLLHTESNAKDGDVESEVRRCRGGSSREAVACAIQAKSEEQLRACAFMGTKSGTASGTTSGTASGTTSGTASGTTSGTASPK
ncbi:MAG TPA: hypothetical protein VHN14_33295 [Kofleriaceae bacterium]|nr:hypothetical protein [Kofleriaceae bacterium]